MKTPTLSRIDKSFDKKFPHLIRRITEPANRQHLFGKITEFDVEDNVKQFYQDKILEMLKYLELEEETGFYYETGIDGKKHKMNHPENSGWNLAVSEVNEKIKNKKEGK